MLPSATTAQNQNPPAPADLDANLWLGLLDIRQLWLLVKRRRILIGAITGGVTLLAILIALLLPSRYEAQTVLMLDPRKTRITNMESVVSSLAPDTAAIRSEIDIIRARAVVDRVIDKLGLMQDPDFNGAAGGLLQNLFGSDEAAKLDEVAQAAQRAEVADALLGNLSVSNDGRSFSVVITYKDTNAARAAKIANSFADEYLVDQLEAKYDVTQRANEWLTGRLENLRSKVQSAEKAVEDYKTKNNLTGVGEETLTQQQLVAINAQLVEARAERSQAEARLKSTEDLMASRSSLEAAATVLSSPLIQRLKEQEAEVSRKAAELAQRYGDRHPTIINVRSELGDIRAKISQEVQKIVQGLRNDVDIANAKVKSLEEQLGGLEGATGAGNQAMVTLRQLQREATAVRTLYEGFLNRSKQVAEQQDMQIADARIIARADVPRDAYFPSKKIFGALGLILGGLLGFAAALLLEYFDRGFRGLSEVERITGHTGIGMVPSLIGTTDQSPPDYVLEKPMSAYAEALRTIRTAIHFSNVDAPPKSVLVTSSVPGEGKTTFCVSLARVLAKAGHKVVLVDADLRRPRVKAQLNIQTAKDAPRRDLAAVLAGQATLEQAIHQDISGAAIIYADSKAPNPQDLLASQQMARLIATLKTQYDMVIIDAPPLVAVADAAMIARHVDTTIYMVRWAQTPREVVQQGIKLLHNFNIRLGGIVLTQVDLTEQANYGYGDYGYYYGRYKEYYTN